MMGVWFDPYYVAEREDIEVVHLNLPDPMKGLWFRFAETRVIVLHRGMSHIEERCVLTEELGHHFLSAGPFVGPVFSLGDAIRITKEERHVLWWVTDRLIETDAFLGLAGRHTSVHDLADYFEVTPRLIRAKYEFMRLVEVMR